MNDYLLFMHPDAPDQHITSDPARWQAYFTRLRDTGQFDGGSSIGEGVRLRKGQEAQAATGGPSGFIRVRASTLAEAEAFLDGNPVYEAGGTVEIRELPRD